MVCTEYLDRKIERITEFLDDRTFDLDRSDVYPDRIEEEHGHIYVEDKDCLKEIYDWVLDHEKNAEKFDGIETKWVVIKKRVNDNAKLRYVITFNYTTLKITMRKELVMK